MWKNMVESLLLLLSLVFVIAEGIVPTVSVEITDMETSKKETFLASRALFGPSVDDEDDGSKNRPPIIRKKRLVLAPKEDPFLCKESFGTAQYSLNNNNDDNNKPLADAIVFVPRGRCNFEWKAISAQRLGASGILIYGTLASRYSLNRNISYTDAMNFLLDDNKYILHKSNNDNNDNTKIYELNDMVDWPDDKFDYDCNNGQSYIPSSLFRFNPPPYNPIVNDIKMKGSNSLCAQNSINPKSFAKNCLSNYCILTGKTRRAGLGGTEMEACCAWDTFIYLYADPFIRNRTKDMFVTIPALYLTVAHADQILSTFFHDQSSTSTTSNNNIYAYIYPRYRPTIHISSILLGILAVFVASLASYWTALDYRNQRHFLIQLKDHTIQQTEPLAPAPDAQVQDAANLDTLLHHISNNHYTLGVRSRFTISSSSSKQQQQQQIKRGTSPSTTTTTTTTHPPPPPPPNPLVNTNNRRNNSIELTTWHALGFIFMASSSLMILFFFKVYNLVKIIYAIGCSGVLVQCIFSPFLEYHIIQNYHYIGGLLLQRTALTIHTYHITYANILSILMGYTTGLTWLYISLTHFRPERTSVYWIIQNLMGACICIIFLSSIKLNSLRMASILLFLIFFYDLFFFFITPYLTNGKSTTSSIMMTVTMSGGPPKADPSWCEKYPSDKDCSGGDPLPMLFIIPNWGDYRGGVSLLGLGDIVLPGLLLSFAARLDEAKKLVSVAYDNDDDHHDDDDDNNAPSSPHHRHHIFSSENRTDFGVLNYLLCPRRQQQQHQQQKQQQQQTSTSSSTRTTTHDYFQIMILSYAIGLLLTNVSSMNYNGQQQQPPLLLLYLIPYCCCCLGTFYYGQKNNWKELWMGPKILKLADRLLINNNNNDDEEEEDEKEELLQ